MIRAGKYSPLTVVEEILWRKEREAHTYTGAHTHTHTHAHTHTCTHTHTHTHMHASEPDKRLSVRLLVAGSLSHTGSVSVHGT